MVDLASLALPYFEKGNDPKNYENCLGWMQFAYFNLEDFEKMNQCSEKLIAFTKKHFGKGSLEYGKAIVGLAVIYDLTGNYQKSIQLNKEALRIEEKKGRAREMATIYGNLGYTYKTLGDLDLALEYFQKASQIKKDSFGIKDFDLPGIIATKAGLYLQNNLKDSAIINYHRAMNLVEAHPPSKYLYQAALYGYQNLADLYLKENKIDSVNYYLGLANMASKQFILFEDCNNQIISGKLFLNLNQPNKALQEFKKAESSVRKEYQAYQRHPEIAEVVTWQAKAYLTQKNYKKAIDEYHRAILLNTKDFSESNIYKNPSAEQFINQALAIDLVANKSTVLFKDYLSGSKKHVRLEAAFEGFALMTSLIENVRQSYFAQGSKALLSGKVLSYFENAIKVSLALYDLTQKESYLEAAWSFAERNKALLLLESITEQSAKDLSGIPDSLLQKDKDISNKLAFYETKLHGEKQKKELGDKEKLKRWEEMVFELKEEKRRLQDFLINDFPKYHQLKGNFEIASVAEIQQHLITESNTLIEYYVGEDELYVFCINKNGLRIHRQKLDNSFRANFLSLQNIISQAPNSQNFESGLQGFKAQAYNFYDLLLKNTLERLPETVREIIFIPDDLLNYLPFEILLTKQAHENVQSYFPSKLDYLFESYSLSYGFSATLLLKSERNEDTKGLKPFLGFAPTFGNGNQSESRDCIFGEVNDLKCNQPEIEQVNELMDGDAFFADAANLENFQSLADQYRILHLSTHACINNENPMLNKIFLADGFLSGYDLTNIALNAKLAVLSACNTGSGKLLKGEGTMSLARGFTLAGCPSTLTTLWSVNDCATSKFVVQFYKNLLKGMEKDEALQQTKFDFLETADLAQSHPYYWAAFVQFGDTELLFDKKRNYWMVLVGGLFLVAIVFYKKKYV